MLPFCLAGETDVLVDALVLLIVFESRPKGITEGKLRERELLA